MEVFYLHGFASSAKSSKAAFLAAKLKERGVAFHALDLNAPDFSTLTITRMLEAVASAVERTTDGAALIGSSLGGFVAVQAAVQHRERVKRLVLLAPALDFGGNRMKELGEDGLREWKETGRLEVFHYGYGRVMPVHYELYADARRYDSFHAQVTQPVQVFQGRRDTLVDPVTVERWASARANVELHLLDDDHQLLSSLDYIWREMSRFLLEHN